MQAFIDFINSIMPTIASAAVIAVSGFVYKKAKGFRNEHVTLVSHLEESETLKEQVQELRNVQEPQNAALREILGDMLDKEHGRLVNQGYACPAEKTAFERKYKAYHGLGGNGTRTALYEDTLQMNSYPS